MIEGRAVAHSRATPFLPAIELLKGYFEFAPDDSDERARQRVDAAHAGHGSGVRGRPAAAVRLPRHRRARCGAAAHRCDGATRTAEGAVPQAGSRRRQQDLRRAPDRGSALDGFRQRIADGSPGRCPARHAHPAAGELPAGLRAAVGQQTVRPDHAGAAARHARRPAGVAPARRRRNGGAAAAADR